MWKITWYDVTNYPYKEECYETFDKAKENFRLAIKEDMNSQIPKINTYVDNFCKKAYKKDIPITFGQLKFLLEKFITTPNYPECRDDLEEIWDIEDYEDEKVDVWLSENLELNVDIVDLDLYDNKEFFECSINFDIGLVKLEPLYCFAIIDNQEQFADDRLFYKIVLEDLERQDEINAAAQEWASELINAIKEKGE